MTPDQVELMKTAARTLLAHRDAGHKCDPEAVDWAEQLLRANPLPLRPVGAGEPDPMEAA